MVCSVKDCSRSYYAKGFCRQHYDKNKRRGSPLFQRVLKKNLLCIAPSCDRNRHANSLCNKHYMKLKRSGTLDAKQVYGEASKKKSRERTAKWKKDNWGYYKAYLNLRKKRVKQALPAWADRDEIVSVYKNCPKGFHVDHIIPLNGKTVSGLHIVENLQYLSEIENLKKGNKISF